MKLKLCVLIAAFSLSIFQGCTRYDPYTGQNQIEPGATAGVAGLALGATALAVAASNNNRYHNDVVVVGRPGYRPYNNNYHYHGGGYNRPRPGYGGHRPGYGGGYNRPHYNGGGGYNRPYRR
jgi:hypothetical protein